MNTKEVVCVDCGNTFTIPAYGCLQRMNNIEYYRCFECRNKAKPIKNESQYSLLEVADQ